MKITNPVLPINNLSAKVEEDNAKLKKACDDFSSIFVSMLWKQMRNTIPENGFLPKSNAEKIFQEMMDDELAKEMARNEGFSLSKTLYEQLRLGISSEKK